MPVSTLSGIRSVQRGGPHKRTLHDELALRDLFVSVGHIDDPKLQRRIRSELVTSVRDVVREVGYSEDLHKKLGRLREAFFELESSLAQPRDLQFKGLESRDCGKRLAAAKWFLSQATKEVSSKTSAWMMSPDVTERLAASIQKEQERKSRKRWSGRFPLH